MPRVMTTTQLSAKTQAGGVPDVMKLPMGDSQWRIIPTTHNLNPVAGDAYAVLVPTGTHYIIDPQNPSKKIAAKCPRIISYDEESCPICDAVNSYKEDPNVSQERQKIIQQGRAQKRFVMVAMRLDGPNAGQIGYLDVPSTVWSDIDEQNKRIEAREGKTAFALNNGRTIIVSRSGQGNKTRYRVDIDHNEAELTVAESSILSLEPFERPDPVASVTKVLNAVLAFAGKSPVATQGAIAAPATASPALTQPAYQVAQPPQPQPVAVVQQPPQPQPQPVTGVQQPMTVAQPQQDWNGYAQPGHSPEFDNEPDVFEQQAPTVTAPEPQVVVQQQQQPPATAELVATQPDEGGVTDMDALEAELAGLADLA